MNLPTHTAVARYRSLSNYYMLVTLRPTSLSVLHGSTCALKSYTRVVVTAKGLCGKYFVDLSELSSNSPTMRPRAQIPPRAVLKAARGHKEIRKGKLVLLENRSESCGLRRFSSPAITFMSEKSKKDPAFE